nr:AAA family ATPase [Siccirubricoccus soli]
MPPNRRWLHGTDLMRGTVSLLVAPGGRGKSALLLAMALACATGKRLLGQHVYASGGLSVLYIAAEEGADELARRLCAAKRHHGVSDAECGSFFIAGVDQMKLTLLTADERARPVLPEEGWRHLESEIVRLKLDVLILDPMANLSATSLNDNHAVTMMMARFTELAVRHDIGIMIAHHTRKGADLGSQEAASGAAAIVNSARIALALEQRDAAAIGVPPGDEWRYSRIVSTKSNNAPPILASRLVRLVSVTLPNRAPPLYPSGDSVQGAEPYTPQKAAWPETVMQVVKHTIATAQPPLSPSPQARSRNAVEAIAAALRVAGREHAQATAYGALEHAIKEGLVAEEDVRLPKTSGGGGSYAAKALRIVPGRSWPGDDMGTGQGSAGVVGANAAGCDA